ncbi:multiubiquitin domain-containing protein [Sphingobium sp.]|uniref:multiubiquitin domain-containing protein n=1 Tax=Sphingobium sp. TaxID=1912891 RepID=UPI000DB34B39|nr:multiubiquitin domain-containing protein [Sphingobium sp.]PZU68039.1 MAG: hypothetical protein DI540_10145 [Sphingobium sp.]
MTIETPKYRFIVNGMEFTTNDPIEEGRDILQKAGFEPASEHVLIELTKPGSRAVGLDEKVDLTELGREEFRAFLSDRTYNFTLDERGYEWGASSISENEIRTVGLISDNRVLVLERADEADREVDTGDIVNLAKKGTEHIRSRLRQYKIIVNAREFTMSEKTVTYAQVVALAFDPVPTGEDVIFTITYRKGLNENPKGTLPENGTINIKNGMIFVVTQTNRS